jgi:hypothetical protein
MKRNSKGQFARKTNMRFIAVGLLIMFYVGAYTFNGFWKPARAATVGDDRYSSRISGTPDVRAYEEIKGQPSNGSAHSETNGADSQTSDPCGLEAVECEGEDLRQLREKNTRTADSRDVPTMPRDEVSHGDILPSVSGFNIASYATLPTHEKTVKAIYDAMPEIADKFAADEYIKSKRSNSPVRGGMVERAANEYGVDMKLMLALMQTDSSFGTSGKGARTMNPGNVNTRDDGHVQSYASWEDGVRAVARWLSKHRQSES